MVAALKALAGEVRALLGPDVKLGYAADWSEYFGYHPQDGSGDVFFHLDPLWADANIDFIGIDNYMPLSDWREGLEHQDAEGGAVALHDLAYLRGNVEGGEGFDWYYASEADRDAQVRTPIFDGAYGEDWIYRYKDLRSWWSNAHTDRIGGVKQAVSTDWIPRSKPIWFTELGCAAIDKGTNEPNKFLDALSSESALPRYSNGRRDDLIQHRYLRAVLGYWGYADNNPVSDVYGGPMLDMSRAHVWAWDTRPWPAFPNNTEVWSDGPNYARGHWLAGRAEAQDLGAVVAELCAAAGLGAVDVSGVYGLVRGFTIDDVGAPRAALQQLTLAHGLDAFEADGTLVFRSRRDRGTHVLPEPEMAVAGNGDGLVVRGRAPGAEMAGRVRLGHFDAQNGYQARTAEAVFPDETARSVSASELPMVLLEAEGRAITERWMAETRIARDTAQFALPPSMAHLGVGETFRQILLSAFAQRHLRQIPAVSVDPRAPDPAQNQIRAVPPGPQMSRRVGPQPPPLKGVHLMHKARIVIATLRRANPEMPDQPTGRRRIVNLPNRPVQQHEDRPNRPNLGHLWLGAQLPTQPIAQLKNTR